MVEFVSYVIKDAVLRLSYALDEEGAPHPVRIGDDLFTEEEAPPEAFAYSSVEDQSGKVMVGLNLTNPFYDSAASGNQIERYQLSFPI